MKEMRPAFCTVTPNARAASRPFDVELRGGPAPPLSSKIICRPAAVTPRIWTASLPLPLPTTVETALDVTTVVGRPKRLFVLVAISFQVVVTPPPVTSAKGMVSRVAGDALTPAAIQMRLVGAETLLLADVA